MADTNETDWNETDWQAQWIWGVPVTSADTGLNGGDVPDDVLEGRYFYFRRMFVLPEGAQAATLRVCADSRYRLWLNGQLVGHGPARSAPAHQYYDVYDIGAQLRAGDNTFAVLATHYGIGTCFACLGSPGFLLQADITLPDSRAMTIATNADWKCAPAPYRTGYERMSIQLAYPEVFDAREEPRSWNFTAFDDSAWQQAASLGPVGTPPWTTLQPRDIPLPYFRAIAPARVLQVNRVEKTEEERGVAQDMERATRLQPAPSGSVTHRHPALFTVAAQNGSEGVSVVLDFGREVSGFPLIVVRRSGGGCVDIGYSERIEADGTVNPNRWGGCDVHYADRLLLRTGHQTYEPLDHRAFRYMRLDFYDCPEPVEMLVEMRLSGYPVQMRGDFQCSDAVLQKVWEVGRYTTELCMDDGFMDCPWRERGQWLGDARVEALVAAYAFGDTLLARKALLQYPQSQEATGWFRGVFPSDPPFDPILPTFCMIWPVALWDYFLLTSDKTLLEAVWPALERLVVAIRRHINKEGLVADLPGWVFVDWAKLDTSGQSTSVNALACNALLHSAKIARALGYPDKGGDWQLLASDIREAVNELLWDRERGVYVDGITQGAKEGTHGTEAGANGVDAGTNGIEADTDSADGQRSSITSEQSNVLCALAGIADKQQTAQIIAKLLEMPSQFDVRIATPYFAFYLLALLFREGRHTEALDYIRARWKPQLDAGATTFWEQWEGHWSQCHAWSAAPTHDLMAHIAGIRPTQPGFEEFDAHPQPCGLSWFQTVVPTPRGDIALAYHHRTSLPHRDPTGSPIPLGATAPTITVNLTVPTNTRAHVRLPLLGIASPAITLNGKAVWYNGVPIPPAGDKFIRDGDTVSFGIIGGRYHIEIE